jgi:hypothetical protein
VQGRDETSGGKLRGVLPDGVGEDKVVLIKACSYLRLTYEIKLSTFLAQKQGKKLWLSCKPTCALAPSLESYLETQARFIKLHRGS